MWTSWCGSWGATAGPDVHLSENILGGMPVGQGANSPYADLRGVWRGFTVRGTKRPYARAAIANAAFPRSCSRFHAAMQPKSRKQPFIDADVSGFQTDPSPHLARIDRGRDEADFNSAKINGRI